MKTIIDRVVLSNGEKIMENNRGKILQTSTAILDEILSSNHGNPRSRGQGASRLPGGLIPGMLHVISGPHRVLSLFLMRIAVVAQLPPAFGGINAKHVFYVELNNDFDPYRVSQIALAKQLSPKKVLGCIEISRGFNWDQSVEILASYLPDRITGKSVVLVSGITSWFDPRDKEHYLGLHETIGGLKRCLRKPDVYMVATAPVADGSRFKPRGGNNLTHFAGCVLSLSVKKIPAGSVLTRLELSQHPAFPVRVNESWDHSANKRIAPKRGSSTSSLRTLEDFFQ
ncbi:MAG: hypothetical protein ACTSUE_26285 [Promethearchaeota archaeon]